MNVGGVVEGGAVVVGSVRHDMKQNERGVISE